TTGLSQAITPAADSTAIIGGNVDLWTANAGINQDIGIVISGGAFGAGQLVAWKESGGNAGTFSPNAAFVQAVVALAAATTYTVKLQWKTNNATDNHVVTVSGSVDGAADLLLAWKESGGFAGTFSPNAAFVQDVFALASGHTYVFKLKWKTNKPQPAGYGVRAGAGLGPV